MLGFEENDGTALGDKLGTLETDGCELGLLEGDQAVVSTGDADG